MENITFKQFIMTYNFRYVTSDKDWGEDTSIIRIYPKNDDSTYETCKWFEFGVYDYAEDSIKWETIERSLSKEILESYINSFWVDNNTSTLHVYLTKNKERDYY